MDNNQFFQKMINEAMPNLVVSNYVIIAEVISESETNLQMILSDTVTPWLASGMLEFASDMIYSGQHQFHQFEEEEE